MHVGVVYAGVYDADFDCGCWNLSPSSNSIEFDDVIILKTMKTWNCQYLGNRIKYIAKIWYVGVIHNFDFGCYIEIGNNWKIGRIWWRPHSEDNENMKLPISWYQKSLGRHWKDPVNQRVMILYFHLEVLTLKALGFFLPMQHWGGGVFSTSYVKLDLDILETWT